MTCRYTYSDETAEDEEEGVPLTSSGVKVAGDLATKLETKLAVGLLLG